MQINTREDARKARELINAKLAELEAEHGLTVTLDGRITYGGGSLTGKVTAVGEGGSSPTAQDYKLQAMFYGLPELGTKLRSNDGKVLEIVGWNSKAQKNNVLLRDQSGKGFHCPPEYVKTLVSAGKVVDS